ncbi:MAG: hypothetical protein KJO79_10765 [Verrucomicrobiae bacterium]|nr:hypothetical protein [Verrucomicrobiae bacterium]NNJ87656.1 hypothetical protein [Akkermansiaceae bacterium]
MTVCLSGCGGLKRYYHPDPVTDPGETLAPVTISVGDSIRLLKHSRGLMWGGYIDGVAIENPRVVKIRYGKDHKNWSDPSLYLIGLKPGVTRAVYCNRIGQQPDFENLRDQERQRCFQIIVTE